MAEFITQSQAEDAIADTNTFLNTERGESIDGEFASWQIAERVVSVKEIAKDLLYAVPHPKLSGLYVPLSRNNAYQYGEVAVTLPGYLVLIPSQLVEGGSSAFYPAVISEQGMENGVIRLHVLKQPYRKEIRYHTSMILSAAGQSETRGIGDDGRKNNDGIEAEHFVTLLAAGSDPSVQELWQNNVHINHIWRREQGDNSVTAEVSQRLFGSEIPQTTITITREQIESGSAVILWHEGMLNELGEPETAARDRALIVIQGMGYEALKSVKPSGIEDLKRMISI